jgi:DNA-binding winged helix-turn-helix (wHTH) protein
MSPRYQFGGFTVSPARRIVLRAGREVPLIPRYFDLLVLLIAERHRAVQRSEILDAVWSDVVVSDGALSQAVRTLRRALGDTAREPLFIRTVSRHGYRFVHPEVVEESDDSRALPAAEMPPLPADGTTLPPEEMTLPPPGEPAPVPPGGAWDPRPQGDPFGLLLRRLLDGGPYGTREDDGARLEAAESLHLLGTREALLRLDRRSGHERGRAFLREARWEVPGAGPVPILGQPGRIRTACHIVALRLRRAARVASMRWGGAAAGGAVAGTLAGFLGGLVLRVGGGAPASMGLPAALSVLGLLAGGAGAAGVGAGLAFAEAVARSMRGAALVLCGAVAGGATGWAAHRLVRGTL